MCWILIVFVNFLVYLFFFIFIVVWIGFFVFFLVDVELVLVFIIGFVILIIILGDVLVEFLNKLVYDEGFGSFFLLFFLWVVLFECLFLFVVDGFLFLSFRDLLVLFEFKGCFVVFVVIVILIFVLFWIGLFDVLFVDEEFFLLLIIVFLF